ncbi:DUF3311 domain-containing protein [Thermococcus sibiricus]|uniref:DUF3311 domain-containing protein n=1 Tax=Thermococcus sibiricus TaxID=172049 RepID=A0A101EJW9_9EURY|nr:DUF3311 domain-containing protein [Thermococcus sibiricus]KUK16728.1 MAG: Uncharacterized protein XD54_1982 [Thermococcus sibiricus]
MNRERSATLIAAFIPLVMILATPAINRIEPYVLGMPFMIFWHFLWLLVGPLVLTVAYLIRTGKWG